MQYNFQISELFINLINSGKTEIHTELLCKLIQKDACHFPELTSITITDLLISFSFKNEITSEQYGKLIIICNNHNYDGIHPETDNIAYLYYTTSPGTNGGSIIKNIWTQVPLNNITGVNVKVWIELLNNNIYLCSGRYDISCQMTPPPNNSSIYTNNVGHYQMRLFDVNNNKTVLLGQNNISTIFGSVEIPEDTVCELQLITQQSVENIGLGQANGFGDKENYVSIKILRY